MRRQTLATPPLHLHSRAGPPLLRQRTRHLLPVHDVQEAETHRHVTLRSEMHGLGIRICLRGW